jgi:hypothetical protein
MAMEKSVVESLGSMARVQGGFRFITCQLANVDTGANEIHGGHGGLTEKTTGFQNG